MKKHSNNKKQAAGVDFKNESIKAAAELGGSINVYIDTTTGRVAGTHTTSEISEFCRENVKDKKIDAATVWAAVEGEGEGATLNEETEKFRQMMNKASGVDDASDDAEGTLAIAREGKQENEETNTENETKLNPSKIRFNMNNTPAPAQPVNNKNERFSNKQLHATPTTFQPKSKVSNSTTSATKGLTTVKGNTSYIENEKVLYSVSDEELAAVTKDLSRLSSCKTLKHNPTCVYNTAKGRVSFEDRRPMFYVIKGKLVKQETAPEPATVTKEVGSGKTIKVAQTGPRIYYIVNNQVLHAATPAEYEAAKKDIKTLASVKILKHLPTNAVVTPQGVLSNDANRPFCWVIKGKVVLQETLVAEVAK